LRFNVFNLAKNALNAHRNWPEQWRFPEPKAAYDVIIIGAGGHGLGTAYYLAKEHGIRNIAVVEKGWRGGGNTGRNTTIIRSNYLWEESQGLYEHSVKLWENLSQELNYNVMYSARGVMMLAHTVHDVQVFKRHIHANRAERRGQRVADAGRVQGLLPAARYLAANAPAGAGRGVAAARRHGAA